MAFTPRSFPQILEDMIAYVTANSVISDFTVGSVARTILEAAALEDDEQYFQMTQLLSAFSLTTARGEELDRRLADFGISRRSATTATVRLRFFDNNLVTQRLAVEAPSGSSIIEVFDSTVFPATGFPYTIRVGEGTTRVEDLSVTANNTTLGQLTVSTLLSNDLEVGDRVNLVTGASARTINTGTTVEAGPTVTQNARAYRTQEPAFIVAGNFFSNEVLAKSTVSGTQGNVGAQRITRFTGGAPFSGAGVINLSSASGGLNRETDAEFRQRALRLLQSLSRGTPLALQTAAVGVTDPATGQRTVSANIIEDFTEDEVFVYIDDGTGLVPDTVPLPSDTLNGLLSIGSSSVPVVDSSGFPSSGYILIEENAGNAAELLEVTSKDDSTNTLFISSTTSITHTSGTTVLSVDVITQNAETGRRRFQLQNPPVVRGTDRIFIDPGTGFIEQTPDTDYVLNRGTGEFQLVDLSGVTVGSTVVAHYTYYTNLISQVQRVLEGDLDNPTIYPGVKAAGIFLSVEAPTIRRITVIASIAADVGFVEADLRDEVRAEIETYISSRRIGEDVILSKIIDVAHNVTGVKDVTILTPTANVSILENELPIPFDSDGNTLVTIL